MKEMSSKKQRVSRRDFIRLGGLSAGAAVLAACGGGGDEEPDGEVEATEESSSEPEESSESAPTQEGNSIVWWFAWGNLEAAVEAIEQLDGFKEHIGDDTFEWASGTNNEQVLTALAGGEPPDGASNLQYPMFWSRGVLIPVDDRIAGSSIIDLDDMIPALVEGSKYDGQMIGVPGIESFLWWGLNYNSDHVSAAGLDPDSPPATVEDALEWHRALTEFDAANNLVKIGLDPYDAMASEIDYSSFAYGLRWWDEENGKMVLDDPRLAEAIDTFGEFYRIAGPDNMAGMRSVEGQGTWGAAYNAGVQSMIIEGYWHPGETQIQQPEIAQYNRASWAPVAANREGGSKIMATGPHFVIIFKDGKNQEGMFKVAEYLQTPESMDIIYNEVGWLVGRLSYLETVSRDSYPGIDFYLSAADTADEYLVGRRSPIHGFVNTQWTELREAVYRDLMTPAEAVAELQKRADDEWEAQGLG
ncbi:MAG: extracellular solute-binding protein [Anaerolineales bacterium]|nr:extracellular solute-binding protein [Anaerolineales bacterium]MCB8960019.1 extracellular solute-binding protein [Ardenticatenales bacterium]